MYSVGRNGPSTSSWTPHLRTRRSDVVPVPLPTPSYVDAYARSVARASRSRQPASMPPKATLPPMMEWCRYVKSVAVAVEACADDTRGQTCYICTQALHWKTKEGLVRGCACRGTAGFAHVSCLAEQAKILVAEAQENNLGAKAFNARWDRWSKCSLCEQRHHGVVLCALGWACWKTHLGRPETDEVRLFAIQVLGSGLESADRDEEALSVKEATVSAIKRIGGPEEHILAVQGNLASSYVSNGRLEEALNVFRDVYAGWLKLYGEEREQTLRAANNYATSLVNLQRFEEPKSLLRKVMPVARRVLGEGDRLTLKMWLLFAGALYEDPSATLDDLREAVATLEETARVTRRVLGGAHPLTADIEERLREARVTLRTRETAERTP